MLCHSESEYAERPVAFAWQNGWLQVEQINQRWRSPQGLRFRLTASDGHIYELFYDLAGDNWQIEQL